MVARRSQKPSALVVVFERGGEKPIRVEAINNKNALARSVAILLAHSKLQIGDCLRIEAADESSEADEAPALPFNRGSNGQE